MASKSRLASVEVLGHSWPAISPSGECLAEFFREEFAKISFPIQVREIRHASEPLNTVAKGCLVAAAISE